MNHTWIEMLSGVSPSIRALAVSTRSETVVDPFRDCPCERSVLELLQQCDIALRTHAEEPPWDLLRIELFQAFGDQVKGERTLTGNYPSTGKVGLTGSKHRARARTYCSGGPTQQTKAIRPRQN